MHIAIFMDQHPRSLGGIQTSVMLQKKFLERAGHRVTIIAPNSVKHRATDNVWLLPAWPLDLRGEFGFVANVRRSRKRLDRGWDELEHKFDLVHIQGEMWSGIIGLGFALRHRLPVVMTMHFNMGKSISDVIGNRITRYLFWLLSRELLKHVNRPRNTVGDPWNYLRLLAAEAAVVFAPSRHYALDLERHGVSEKVEVVHNGVDDDIVRRILESEENASSKANELNDAAAHKTRQEKSVRLVWSGRMQWEKRPLEFLQAVSDSGIEAQVELYGRGILMRKAQRLARELKLNNVHFKGSVPYSRMLRAFADADALVQTSVGFETQGMTVYEAAAVGTPSILCDHNIAKEFGAGTMWVVADDSVASLAKSLRRAVDDILAGDERYKKLARENHILQSGATNRMLRFYKSVVSKSQAPKY
ncbi:MAG: hypothetical protein RLZZ400_854, partial [Actinomycetota bacterium]